MISDSFSRVSKGRLIWGIVLALVIGAMMPLLTMLQIVTLVPVLMLGGVFAVFLHCCAGWVPAAVLMAAGLASTAWFMGMTMMWMTVLAAFLPAGVVIRGIMARRPFFEQLRNGVIAYGVGLLAALGIAYTTFGTGMVTQFVEVVRAEIARMPDSAFTPFLDTLNAALLLNGVQGVKMITIDVYRAQVNGVLDLMRDTYARMLPGALLCGALMSGIASVLWGNWRMARRGMATDDSFVGLSRWFLPGSATVGMLAMWLASYLIAASRYASGATVYATVYQLVCAVFSIQGYAAFDRRMIATGRPLKGRRIAIGLFLVAGALIRMLGTLMFAMGVLSALLGSRGVIRQRMEDREDNHSDHDDPEQ